MEWTNVSMLWCEFRASADCRPGVQVEVKYGKSKEKVKEKFLIGDINTLAGICDDCVAFDREAKVIRYRQLLTKEQLE